MKKIISLAVIALLAFSAPSFAQSKAGQKTKKAWKGTKEATSKAAHKTAELASKGKAKATDKKSDQWIGPRGRPFTLMVTNIIGSMAAAKEFM